MGHELSKDMIWGDDCLLTPNSRWRVGVRAQAVAYVSIGSLVPEQLIGMALERGYVGAYRKLRRHAALIALRRYLIKTSAQARLTNKVVQLKETLEQHQAAGGVSRLSQVVDAGGMAPPAGGGSHAGAFELAAMAAKVNEDAKRAGESKGGGDSAQDKKRKGWGVGGKKSSTKDGAGAVGGGTSAAAGGGSSSGGSSGSTGSASGLDEGGGSRQRGIKWANDVDFSLRKQQPQVEGVVEDDEVGEETNAPLSGLGAFLGFGSARIEENTRENANIGAGGAGLGALPPSIPLPAAPSRALPPAAAGQGGGVNDKAAFDLLQEISRRLAQQQGQIDKLCKRLDAKDAVSRAPGSADGSSTLTA